MKMKRIAWWLPLVALVFGCGGLPTSKELAEIDQLLAAEKNDSAYQIISTYDPASFKKESERAYYNLLMTHAACVTYHFPASDSLINEAIGYYKRTGDRERLADSYYYKGELYFQHEDWPKAIEIYKLAEEQAEQTDNIWLKYKIYDAIGGVNQQSGNYQMCLDYGRKALDYILRIGRRSSICGAYMQMATTFAFLQQTDSAAFYTDKAIPYLKDYQNVVGENIHPDFFSNIGYNYMVVGRYKEAKQYLEQSLMVKVTAVACNYLAWIYKQEGDEEQSYLLNLKAHEIGDNWPKDKILYELLRYDIEHNNLEGAQEKLKGMMTISDSLHKAQMDRTILEYQHRFDEQVAQEAHQRKMIWVGIALGVLLFVIVLLALYIRYRRAKEQVALAEKQMLINNYVSEIAQLKSQQNDTDVAGQIEELNGKIRELVEQNSPRLVRGKMLYDDIKKDGTTSGWSNDDYKYFIDFYKAIDFPAFCRIQKKYAPNTPHNTFFLILYEMGMDDKDVRRIMGVTQEAIRSTRHRILRGDKRKQK